MTTELIPLHDDEIDQQILKRRVAGLSVLEIAKQMGMPRHQVLAALDRNLPQIDASYRRRQIGLSLLRLDELSETFLKQAKTGDVESGSLCIRIECERRALLGLGGAGYDAVQLVQNNTGESSMALISRGLDVVIERLRNEKPSQQSSDPTPAPPDTDDDQLSEKE